MRVLLLVNSTASSVTPRKRSSIRKILSAAHDVEVAETSRRGHATLLARAAAEDDFDVVAVLAGDGTLNEAAAGLLHTRTALAPLPGGSTNVYAQTLGYPRHTDDAAHALVGALGQRVAAADRRRARRRAAVPVLRGHRVRRRGDPPGRAPLPLGQADRVAPAPHRGGRALVLQRGGPPHARARRRRGRPAAEQRPLRDRVEGDALHAPRAAAAQHRPQRQHRHAAVAQRVHPAARAHVGRRRRVVDPLGQVPREPQGRRGARRPRAHPRVRRHAVPLSGRRRRRGRHDRAGHHVRARRAAVAIRGGRASNRARRARRRGRS